MSMLQNAHDFIVTNSQFIDNSQTVNKTYITCEGRDPKLIAPVKKDDIVIAFMGPTGTGKSSFINLLAGGPHIENTPKPETARIKATRVQHAGYDDRIVLVDIPAFDDTPGPDVEVLRMISNWLEQTYKENVKLSGIVYLHCIVDSCMTGSPLKNLQMFNKLCGDVPMDQVALVSTMWEKVRDDIGRAREQELKENSWKPFIEHGAMVDRLTRTQSDEAWRIIDQLIQRTNMGELLVDIGMRFKEALDDGTLYGMLQKLLADQMSDSLKPLFAQVETWNDTDFMKGLMTEVIKQQEGFQKMLQETSMWFFGSKPQAEQPGLSNGGGPRG